MGDNFWHDYIPNEEEFSNSLVPLRRKMGEDVALRAQSLDLIQEARKYNFAYHLRWMGVPVIRMAEDLIRQQEIIYSIRPEVVIEIGVARGGGLLFGASMQEVAGITPNVIGVDNVIMPHTRQAIVSSRYSQNISLIEADSDSDSAIGFVRGFLKGKETALMILDSDHSSQHVLTELRAYFDILPVGSMVIVCDTIIDELPPGTFPGRSWSNGFGPGHAIEQFLRETPDAELVPDATADLLITEIRMGVLRKIPTAKLSR